ncbi:helix-turn-helix domain-containing protein [Paenibacillus sp. MDMC362]|uniref:helix-turn-helix domain-containing protein n=1 Tax=Paenibacillus sp. MDMC362 TaxID=2977365 RepID=UPI0021A74076|nr:helix-turn-helix domain-containing protein [Paenibacillus sp. MDMC362]
MTTVDFIEDIKQKIVEELQPVINGMVEEMYQNRIKRATLTAEQAAEYIGVSKPLLYTMVNEGQISCIQAGSLNSQKPHYKFRLSTLDKWMDESEKMSLVNKMIV